ncbi:NAD-dependent epimerase/dehydratase family protein [Streptomyces varsoviensis]|nr:NAD-dependent epimerase/dehydratase family protein [Streptomyces varsoviensis]
MRLLILGGTEFVGRALTEEALKRGWETTVFHRGRHAAPPGVTTVLGDRTAENGLAGLAGGEWDAVVDTWAGAPTAVRDAARLLADRAPRYAYISSRSVYRHPCAPGLDESGALVDGSPDAGDVEYPEAKRGGELAAVAAFGDRALLVRAGLILGPWENVGRLLWWLNRMARGGPVLAPGPRDSGIQFVDPRDLAAWTLGAIEQRLGGPYNLVSPRGHATMGELLDACARVTGGRAELRWTAPEKILAAGVEPWTEIPVWIPPGELHDTIHAGGSAKAIASGLRCRPVAETVTDTWTWLQSLPSPAPLRPDIQRTALTPQKEAEILAM